VRCSVHIDREAVNTCSLCGDSLCQECLVQLVDKSYCRKCLQQKISEPVNPVILSAAEEVSLVEAGEKKSRLWAFVFSLVPGVGYLYLGLMNRGLQTMVLFFGAIFVASFIGFGEIMALIVPVVMFYSIFDTQQLVKSINAGDRPEDKQFFDIKQIPYTHNWIGWGLIVIGILALIRHVPFFWSFWPTFNRLLPPVMIIGIGILILYRNTKKD